MALCSITCQLIKLPPQKKKNKTALPNEAMSRSQGKLGLPVLVNAVGIALHSKGLT